MSTGNILCNCRCYALAKCMNEMLSKLWIISCEEPLLLENKTRSLKKPWILPLSVSSYCLLSPVYNGFLCSKPSSCKVREHFLPGAGSVILRYSRLRVPITSQIGFLQESASSPTPKCAVFSLGEQSSWTTILFQLLFSNMGFTCTGCGVVLLTRQVHTWRDVRNWYMPSVHIWTNAFQFQAGVAILYWLNPLVRNKMLHRTKHEKLMWNGCNAGLHVKLLANWLVQKENFSSFI